MKNLILKGETCSHRALFDHDGKLKETFTRDDVWEYMVVRLEGHRMKIESLEEVDEKRAELIQFMERKKTDPFLAKNIDRYLEEWGLDLFLYGIDLCNDDLNINWRDFEENKTQARIAQNVSFRKVEA